MSPFGLEQVWWFLPTLPQGYLAKLEDLIVQLKPKTRSLNEIEYQSFQDDLTQSLIDLILTAESKRRFLCERVDSPWFWQAELKFDQWTVEKERIIAQVPMKYWVELNLHLENSSEIQETSESKTTCLFSPAELKYITLVDVDLGRRIGDELDGSIPT